MAEKTKEIHDTVQERYAKIAKEAGQESCCGPVEPCCDSSEAQKFYDEEMLTDLPVDVTGLSLGCGDPVTIAELKPGEVVLDLGSGGGIDCFLASEQVGESGQVIGIDMTPEMLEQAEANKQKMGVSNVEFRLGKIEELPVEDDYVDVIMSNCVINLSPDKSAVFQEAYRVLKSGGRISVSDIVTEGDFDEAMRSDLAKWSECITGAIDIEDYIGKMEAAGFRDIEVHDKVEAKEEFHGVLGAPRIFSARIIGYK
jgi:SAM-dependent methyltransferase